MVQSRSAAGAPCSDSVKNEMNKYYIRTDFSVSQILINSIFRNLVPVTISADLGISAVRPNINLIIITWIILKLK